MEPARLASKQASSKQLRRALSGPQSNKGPEVKKKCHHAIQDDFPQLLREQIVFLVGPPPVGNGDFGGILARLGPGAPR